jgi:hypothetical protein
MRLGLGVNYSIVEKCKMPNAIFEIILQNAKSGHPNDDAILPGA